MRAVRGDSGEDSLGVGADSSLLLGQAAGESGGGATDVVLLADADGNIGEMSVANDAGEQVFNQANTGRQSARKRGQQTAQDGRPSQTEPQGRQGKHHR